MNEKIKRLKKEETGNAKVGDNGLDPGDEASQSRIYKNLIRHKIELRSGRTIHTCRIHRKDHSQKKCTEVVIDMPEKPWQKGYFDSDVIYSGGDVYSQGDAVEPGGLSAAESLEE